MKPNLLVVQPPHVDADAAIGRFCESMCESHYVYLIRPATQSIEDSPAGVRFLKYSPDRLPGFGEVESVVVVADPEIAGRVKEQYPTAHHALWNLETDGDSPLLQSRQDTIIQGEFGQASDQPLARAI